MTTLSTKTDAPPPRWVSDSIFRLREWADEEFHWLDPTRPITIGTARTCTIKLRSESGHMSRTHARLEKLNDQWHVTNLSKNGVYLDGVRQEQSVLLPGVQISIGGKMLVAESPRMIALRSLFARLIGWDPKQREPIDVALQAFRAGTMRRAITVLCGDGHLAPIAEELHNIALPRQPFVLCHPHPPRESGEAAIERASSGLEALAQATGGTVCVLNEKQPDDLDKLLEELARPTSNVRLIVCAQREQAAKLFHARPIVLPSLARRHDEIDRVIDEYAALARAFFKMKRFKLEPADRVWIRRRHGETLAEIQRATHRLAAVYCAGGSKAAAPLLGLSYQGLEKWLESRGFNYNLPRG